MTSSLLRLLSITAILPILASCTGKDEPDAVVSADPAAHFQGLANLVSEGKVASAYVSFLPPQYASDADQMLTRATGLITEEEFAKAHSLLKQLGNQLAPVMNQLAAEKKDELAPVIAGLSDLPKLLGIATYSDFQKLTMTSLMSSLEENLFRKLAEVESFRKELAGLKITAEETTNSYVVLKSTKTDGQTSTFKVIQVDGRWVPADMAKTWKRDLEGVLESIDQFAEAKKADPQIIMKQLTQMEAQMGMLAGMLGAMGQAFTQGGSTTPVPGIQD